MHGPCHIIFLTDILTEVFINIFESVKLKFTPRYASVGTEVWRKYISNIFVTSGLEDGWPISTTSRPLYHRETYVAYFTGGI